MEGDNQKKGNRKAIIGILIFVVAAAVLAMVYFAFRSRPVEGNKEITIEVLGKDKPSEVYELKTDAEYLRQAMEEAEGLTFDGEDGEYGMMVYTVNGETADFEKDGAYWSFNVNGEYCNYGIDSQPVMAGDYFTIQYSTSEE